MKARTIGNLPAYLKCLADPFSMPACRMPDLFGGNTTAIKLVDEYTVGSDASGVALWAVGPALVRANYTYTQTAGVISAGAYTPHADNTTIGSNSLWSRLVCFGVEVTYIGATATASGFLTRTQDHGESYWAGSNISTICDDGVTARADQGCAISLIPVQEPRFDNENGTAFNTPTFPYAYFSAQGLPASTTSLFRVRVTRHMECLPYRSSALMRDSAAPSLADPIQLAASSYMATVPNSSVNTSSARSERSQSIVDAAWSGLETLGHKAAVGVSNVASDWAEELIASWLL